MKRAPYLLFAILATLAVFLGSRPLGRFEAVKQKD